MRSSFILSLLAVVAPALGAPTLVPITKRAGPSKDGSYIVKLKDGSSKPEFINSLTRLFDESSSGSSVTYDYGDIFHGVAVQIFGLDVLGAVRGMKSIESIEQDNIVSLSHDVSPAGESAGSTVDPGHSLAARADPSGGVGVDIYIVDTGIRTDHVCFEGRARWGKTFGGYADQDGNGHGTHVAGIAAGKGYGPATTANLIAVKVLSDEGSGSTSDIVAGMMWAIGKCDEPKDPKEPERACVINMSLGGLASPEIILAAVKTYVGGAHLVVAAGNSNLPLVLFSPANSVTAITVGAVDQNNKKASFSNYGPLLDIWALGVNVRSAWKDGVNSEAILSGTSMAAPCVTRILAIVVFKHGNKSPSALSKQLKEHGEPVVTDTHLSTNRLARSW